MGEHVIVTDDSSAAQAAVGPVYPTSRRSRALLVEDDENTGFRMGVLLEGTKKSETLGEAEDGTAGIGLAGALRPDVGANDSQTPGQRGVDAVPLIRTVAGEAEIVVPSDRVLRLTWLERQRLAADLRPRKGSDGYAIRAARFHVTAAPDTPLVHTTRTFQDRRRDAAPVQVYKRRRQTEIQERMIPKVLPGTRPRDRQPGEEESQS